MVSTLDTVAATEAVSSVVDQGIGQDVAAIASGMMVMIVVAAGSFDDDGDIDDDGDDDDDDDARGVRSINFVETGRRQSAVGEGDDDEMAEVFALFNAIDYQHQPFRDQVCLTMRLQLDNELP